MGALCAVVPVSQSLCRADPTHLDLQSFPWTAFVLLLFAFRGPKMAPLWLAKFGPHWSPLSGPPATLAMLGLPWVTQWYNKKLSPQPCTTPTLGWGGKTQ